MARTAARIAAELCRRIVAQEVRPGEAVPAGEELARELDVTVAVARRALAMLRRDGLVEDAAGGTVVAERAPGIAAGWRPPVRQRRVRAPAGADLPALAVRTAVDLADARGLAEASMRQIALRLDVEYMTLRKHVPDRAHLETLMADAIFAGHPPQALDAPAGDWRARLELLCRAQLELYRRHRWLAEAVSFQRPQLAPHVAGHTAWAARALADEGLAAQTAQRVAATAANFVRGHAMTMAQEPPPAEPAAPPTGAGPTEAEQVEAEQVEAEQVEAERDDALFEFGLQRLLDGFAPLVPPRRSRSR